MSITLWVIQADSLVCHADGTPFVLSLANAPKYAIHLGFSESHNDSPSTIAQHHEHPVSHVIDSEHACQLGLMMRFGDGFDTKDSQNLKAISFRNLLNTLDSSSLDALSRAIMLVQWQNDHRYCSRCGTPTHAHAHGEHAKVCPKCRHHAYPRVQPCIIVAITRHCPDTHKPQILLTLHHRHRQKGVYGLIAGFVEAGETLEMGVHREVFEEVGIHIHAPTYISSQPWPYPSNLMAGFIAEYHSGAIRVQAGEISDAKFFDLDNLPPIPAVGTIAHELISLVKQRYLPTATDD